jgi:hypothetical protein
MRRQTLHPATKGRGLGIRPANKHRKHLVQICAEIDVMTHDTPDGVEVIEYLRRIRDHADNAMIELLVSCLTNRPLRRQRSRRPH